MTKYVREEYRARQRPGIIAWACLILALVLAVATSFFLAGSSNLDRRSSQEVEDIRVSNISAVPGHTEATCWQASSDITETNYLGTSLLTHRFSLIWCAQDGGIIYREDATKVTYEGRNMHSREPANQDYIRVAALGSPETADITLARGVTHSNGWSSYGFERCLTFTVDAQGKAEGSLSCHSSN